MTQYESSSGLGADRGGEEAEVQGLLDQLARAVTSGDGRAAARHWEVPALVLSDQGVHAISSSAEVEQFFGGAKQQYNDLGIVDTRADIQRITWPTRRLAIVEVRWPWLDANGRESGSETSTYTFRRDDSGQLKLRTAVLHGVAKDD
jgi:hypothetical protein